MTVKEKQILIADLCARLPYGVMIESLDSKPEKLTVKSLSIIMCMHTNEYLPYLRPMSSMTKEEEEEWWEFGDKNTIVKSHSYSIDWLNSHHFDYRGLIPKGLALEAIEGMYIIK